MKSDTSICPRARFRNQKPLETKRAVGRALRCVRSQEERELKV